MIPAEGMVVVLKAVTAVPMWLCLFTDGPDKDADQAAISARDFTEAGGYERFPVERRHWRIDEAQAEAAVDEHRFGFTAPAGKVAGWYLQTLKDQAILAFDRFKEPYPINSNRDTISVRARLRLRRVGG